MAAIPVYMLSVGARIAIIYLAYKAVEKFKREFLLYPSSSAAHAAAAGTQREWYPSSSSVAPAVTVDTGVCDHVSFTEDVPDRVSSTEDAPVSVGSLEELHEEFQTVGLQDNNKGNVHRDDFKEDNIEWDSPVRKAKPTKILYPQKPDAIDCSNYICSGSCRNGSNCGYTHPPKKENQIIKEKEKEDLSEQKQQQECKPGGCKFGKACRYKHSWEKPTVPPPLDFNFLGLPIRPGKKECVYYMRDGSCKYGPDCRFHHPDPTAVGEGDVPSGSVSLYPSGASQPASTSCSSPPSETVPYRDAANLYVPTMLPPQGVRPNPEWNGYQGKQEFLYHMCDESSKHGLDCNFHHPDPTCVRRGDIPFGSVSLQPSGASQPASTSWSSPPPPNETLPYLDAADSYVPMMLPPQGLHTNPEWNGYQGERECLYYMHDGSCKYGPNYRFHHPGSISLHQSGTSQQASTSWSSPSKDTVPYLDAAYPYTSMMLPPQGLHPNSEWNVYQASSRPKGTQPLFAANPNPLDWSKPKTQPAVNGTLSKDAKKTKIVKSVRCEICKIECHKKDVLDQHKLGIKHKKNLEKLEESKKEASAPSATAALAAKDPVVGPKESPVADKGKTVGAKQGNGKGATSFGPGEDLETPILQSAWCDICKIDCKSKNVLDQHKFGKKHKNNLEKLKESKKEASAPSATAALAAKDPVVGSKESPVADKGKIVGAKQGNGKGATSFGPGEDLETPILQSAWCEICKIDCKSKNVLDQPKFGKKHKNNLEKLEESKKEASAPAATEAPVIDKGKTKKKGAQGLETEETDERWSGSANAVWMCRVCNVTCNSQTVYTSHLAGQKHANLVQKQAAAAGTTNLSDSWGGFYFLEDELL